MRSSKSIGMSLIGSDSVSGVLPREVLSAPSTSAPCGVLSMTITAMPGLCVACAASAGGGTGATALPTAALPTAASGVAGGGGVIAFAEPVVAASATAAGASFLPNQA